MRNPNKRLLEQTLYALAKNGWTNQYRLYEMIRHLTSIQVTTYTRYLRCWGEKGLLKRHYVKSKQGFNNVYYSTHKSPLKPKLTLLQRIIKLLK